jgi:hypothetical protein
VLHDETNFGIGTLARLNCITAQGE